MDEIATILADIERFREACQSEGRKMATTTFGRLSVNDGKLVRRLKAGRPISTATIGRIRAFIASQTTVRAA